VEKIDGQWVEDGWIMIYSSRAERYVRLMPLEEWREREKALKEIEAAPEEEKAALLAAAQAAARKRRRKYRKHL